MTSTSGSGIRGLAPSGRALQLVRALLLPSSPRPGSSRSANQLPALQELFAAATSPSATARIRSYFGDLGQGIQADLELRRATAERARLESSLGEVRAERDRAAAELQANEAECQRLASALAATEAERQLLASALAATEAERQLQSSSLSASEAERQRLASALAASEAEHQRLGMGLRASDARERQLRADLADLEQQRTHLRARAEEQQASVAKVAATEIRDLQHRLRKMDRRLRKLRRSCSWRATRPIRWLGSLLKHLPAKRARRDEVALGLPGGPIAPQPEPAAEALASDAAAPAAEPVPIKVLPPEIAAVAPPVPYVRGTPPPSPVRLVAFHRSEFSSDAGAQIGAGPAPWSAVAAAQPVFAGHYQPHVPGDLGFYDLRLAESWRQQVELARAYGVTHFASWCMRAPARWRSSACWRAPTTVLASVCAWAMGTRRSQAKAWMPSSTCGRCRALGGP